VVLIDRVVENGIFVLLARLFTRHGIFKRNFMLNGPLTELIKQNEAALVSVNCMERCLRVFNSILLEERQ